MTTETQNLDAEQQQAATGRCCAPDSFADSMKGAATPASGQRVGGRPAMADCRRMFERCMGTSATAETEES